MTIEKQGGSDQSILSSLTLAEQIAHFRARLELDMVHTEWYPAAWQKVYEERLQHYPQILPYRAIFDHALEMAKEANQDLNRFWRRRCGPRQREAGENSLERTGGFSARNLFTDVLGLEPIGTPEAIKGMVTLRFMVDDQDFQSICRKYHVDCPEKTGAINIPLTNFRFWALVVDKERSPKLIDEITLHELEHSKNAILLSSRYQATLSETAEISPAIARRKRIRESRDPLEMWAAKNELLAHFTVFEQAKPNLPPEKMFRQLPNKCVKIYRKAIPSVLHLFEVREWDKDRKERFLTAIEKGLIALPVLFKLYAQLGYDYYGATRMSINVLEQFPLTYWPAMVRLLFRRYGISRE